MKAIIVAAGEGKRLMPYTKDKPKCLVKIGDNAILEYALSNFSDCGISEVVVVIGYHFEMFKKIIGTKYKNCNIKYIVNKDYATTDNMTSLWLAKDDIDEGFIFVNADILFQKEILRRLLDDPHPDVCVIDNNTKLTPSAMKLKIADDKIVAIGRNLADGNARAIGMYKFSPRGGRVYFKEIEKLINSGNSMLQIEPPLELFLQHNDLCVLRTGDYFWEEIDEESDLKNAEKNLNKLLR